MLHEFKRAVLRKMDLPKVISITINRQMNILALKGNYLKQITRYISKKEKDGILLLTKNIKRNTKFVTAVLIRINAQEND